MPEGKGYKEGMPAQHYPGSSDPNVSGHTYSKNDAKGTHPYPKNDAAGETAFTHAHKRLGDRSGGRRGPNLENLRS